MKISIAQLLLVCSLFLVASCGVKGPLYHEKPASVAKTQKTDTEASEDSVKASEQDKEEDKKE
jgi:predicted small lipoprotein YifL